MNFLLLLGCELQGFWDVRDDVGAIVYGVHTFLDLFFCYELVRVGLDFEIFVCGDTYELVLLFKLREFLLELRKIYPLFLQLPQILPVLYFGGQLSSPSSSSSSSSYSEGGWIPSSSLKALPSGEFQP